MGMRNGFERGLNVCRNDNRAWLVNSSMYHIRSDEALAQSVQNLYAGLSITICEIVHVVELPETVALTPEIVYAVAEL